MNAIQEPVNNAVVDINQVIETLKVINWQKFHELCVNIGSDFNSPQLRFLKAIVLESSIDMYSKHVLTYVGDEETGCDFKIPSLNNLKVEMKYTQGSLFGGKKLEMREITKDIKLLNSLGTNKHANLPDNYSDYLLIVDMHGAALIDKPNLIQYVRSNGDGLNAKIPTDKLHILFRPSDLNMEFKRKNLNIEEKLHKFINQILLENLTGQTMEE